jgi:hypothetical protein
MDDDNIINVTIKGLTEMRSEKHDPENPNVIALDAETFETF